MSNKDPNKCLDLTALSQHPWVATDDSAIEAEKRAFFEI